MRKKLHQVVHRAAAHVGGPVLGLDAVNGVLGADLAAVDAAVLAGAEGVNVRLGRGAAVVHRGRVAGVDGHRLFIVCLSGDGVRRFGQGAAAVRTAHSARRVVGAAVGAGGLVCGLVGVGADLGLPLKPGGVLGFVHTYANFLPAGPVVGCAAVRANDDIVLVGKCLFADRAVVSGVTCHVVCPRSSFSNIKTLYRIKWINAKKT